MSRRLTFSRRPFEVVCRCSGLRSRSSRRAFGICTSSPLESGSARLTNIAKAILDDVALRMKQEPTSTAIVIGYTDSKEATGPNADLDRRRAEAVRDYLVSRHGIDPSRITIEGRDAREPVGDNNTAEGRLKNRRVVIRLMLP